MYSVVRTLSQISQLLQIAEYKLKQRHNKQETAVCLIRATQNRFPETLGSYRDCPGRRSRIEPGSSVRGSFDRIV